jgi:outer membrane protein insertion porin family
VGLNASVAGDLVDFPTAQAEGTVALTLPYLLWPLGGLERALDLDDARSQLSLGFLTARRDELRLLIRGRATAGLRFELHHRPDLTSLVDVLDFRLSDPDTLSGFREQFLDLIEDPVARQFVLEDYTRPQINNAVRYTIRSLTADPLRRDRGHAAEAAVEFGGNLPYLLDRFVFTPGEVEGSIPGVPLFGGGGRLEYRPYARATVDARHYLVADRLTVLASRAVLGIAHPTGQAPVVPFDRRFYAGGAGSVRGWDLRQLGPGRIPPEASAFVQGGDVRLEANVELRRVVLRRLFAADWQLAAFADVGNVWFGPRNPGDPAGRFRASTFYEELAVGSGVGVRALWDFLILRLDVAWKVRSPVPGDPLFPEGNQPRLHFGIGQSF